MFEPGRAGGASVVDVNIPKAFAILLLSESRQVSISPGSVSGDSAGFAEERSWRSFHLLPLSGVIRFGGRGGGSGGGRFGSGWSADCVSIQGTSSPDPFRLKYRGLNNRLDSRGMPTSSSAVGGRLDSSPEVCMSPATRLATCNEPMSCMTPGTLVSE